MGSINYLLFIDEERELVMYIKKLICISSINRLPILKSKLITDNQEKFYKFIKRKTWRKEYWLHVVKMILY